MMPGTAVKVGKGFLYPSHGRILDPDRHMAIYGLIELITTAFYPRKNLRILELKAV